MRLHRFYTSRALPQLLTYTDKDHIHQWKNVFRYSAGDSLILFGDGFEHVYKIESMDKKAATLREDSRSPSIMQEKELTVALALIKRDNFELVLQKCTEIGVTNFIPLITDRSLQKMFSVDRLEKILTEATEQSGWGSVPKISDPIRFNAIEMKDATVLDQDGAREVPKTSNVLLVGPEGGWSEKERVEMVNKKYSVWSLKTGVLRAETAAIAISSLILI